MESTPYLHSTSAWSKCANCGFRAAQMSFAVARLAIRRTLTTTARRPFREPSSMIAWHLGRQKDWYSDRRSPGPRPTLHEEVE